VSLSTRNMNCSITSFWKVSLPKHDTIIVGIDFNIDEGSCCKWNDYDHPDTSSTYFSICVTQLAVSRIKMSVRSFQHAMMNEVVSKRTRIFSRSNFLSFFLVWNILSSTDISQVFFCSGDFCFTYFRNWKFGWFRIQMNWSEVKHGNG
jgi:hypothetical protein